MWHTSRRRRYCWTEEENDQGFLFANWTTLHTSDTLIGTALMNMYGKHDSLIDLENTFSLLSCRDLVSWNAMLSVLGDQGHGERILHQEMQNLGVLANDVTLLSVLHACRKKLGA